VTMMVGGKKTKIIQLNISTITNLTFLVLIFSFSLSLLNKDIHGIVGKCFLSFILTS
jgi:hypothetical protein